MSAQANSLPILIGGCQCGAVRYTARGRGSNVYACHCTACQKRSGSAFALLLPVSQSGFSCTGETTTLLQEEARGTLASLFSCACCATRLYTTNPLWPKLVILRGGTLDNRSLLSPAFHTWVSSKQEWMILPDGAKQFETQPGSPEEWRAALS